MNRKKLLKRGWLGGAVSYAYLTILSIIAIFPLLWILLSSIKSKGELAGDPTSFLPKSITFDNFRTVFGQLGFGNNVMNSIISFGSIWGCAILPQIREGSDAYTDYYLYVPPHPVGSALFYHYGEAWLNQ